MHFQVLSLIMILDRLRDMLAPVDVFQRPLTVQEEFSIMSFLLTQVLEKSGF